MPQQYDVTLKAILQNAMPGLLRLLGLPGGPVEYLTVEFPVREKLLPDWVVRLADGRILHIELQSRNDPEMEWRCLDYFRVISRRWKGTRIVQVVVYLGDGPMTMASRIEESELRFGFQVLNLQEVEARFFLESENEGERMLAMLCRSEDPRATIAAILGSWKHLPVKELAARLGELLVLSQLRNRGTMVEEEVKAMPVDLDIEENQLFIMGERRGVAKTLIKMLEHRFGPLSEALQKRIKSADRSALDRWVDRMDQGFPLDSIFGD